MDVAGEHPVPATFFAFYLHLATGHSISMEHLHLSL